MEDRFLGREDPDAARLLFEQLERDGLDIRLGTRLVGVERRAGEAGSATLSAAGGEQALAFDQILVAAGRTPNVEGLGLEAAGVAFEAGRGVAVDDCFRTGNRHVYATGDVCMEQKFTHAADFASRAAIQNALFALGPFGRKKLSALTIPRCTYTDPEIAHVGLDEAEAAARGIATECFERRFAEVDRAIVDGREGGFIRIRVKKGSDRILGATVVGYGASDLISEINVARAAGLGLGALASVIHPYPTRAEAIRQLGDAYNRTRLTPGARRILKALLAWRP
jgi:pyruvate/2-oxoglutarate dehydrogenase complex dihydrolipoamide dehydrogenase (E3) component